MLQIISFCQVYQRTQKTQVKNIHLSNLGRPYARLLFWVEMQIALKPPSENCQKAEPQRLLMNQSKVSSKCQCPYYCSLFASPSLHISFGNYLFISFAPVHIVHVCCVLNWLFHVAVIWDVIASHLVSSVRGIFSDVIIYYHLFLLLCLCNVNAGNVSLDTGSIR